MRGAFFDPGVGTVSAVGDRLLAIAAGRTRELADLGVTVQQLGRGPGDTCVALFGEGQVAIVPLRAGHGRIRHLPIPADLRLDGARPESVIRAGAGTLLLASDDGRVDLVRARDGKEIRGVRLGSGPIDLAAAGEGRFLATRGGAVDLRESSTLALRRSARLLSRGPAAIVSDPAARLAVAYSIGGEAAFLTLPDLDLVTHPAVPDGLLSAAFADAGRELFLAADVPYVGGTDQAAIVEWPTCKACLGDAAELRRVTRGALGAGRTAAGPEFTPRGPTPLSR